MILITNDDGYSDNLKLLYSYCQTIDNEVVFVVPSVDQSNVGNNFSINKLFQVNEKDEGFVIDGTPVDCIRYGLSKFEPDLIITGVNDGFNISVEALLKSGTFMSAREGYLHGVKSLACSTDMFNELNYDLLKTVLDEVLGFNFKLANLNIVSDFVMITSLCSNLWKYEIKDNVVNVCNNDDFELDSDGDAVFNKHASSLTIFE